MRKLFGASVIVISSASVGCEAPSSTNEHTGQQVSALSGGGTTNVGTSTALPEAAVVQLRIQLPNNGVGLCTGTVLENVGRLGGAVILTAAHCFCGTANGLGSAGTTTQQTVAFNQVGQNNAFAAVTVSTKFYGSQSIACAGTPQALPPRTAYVSGGNIGGLAISDLAIIQTTTPLALTALPRVYTGGDFVTRSLNFAEAFPPMGRSVTAASPVPGGFALLRANVDGPRLHTESACTDALGMSCNRFYHWMALSDGAPQLQGGDSGGPLAFTDGGRTVIFGVASGFIPVYDWNIWSTTWDNGNGNGDFIRSLVSDLDEDGVDDAVDNCPPSRCADDPMRCANANQLDADGDGVGDACDNCPASVCTARGWPAAACANSLQTDDDHDGTGDVCDNCPSKRNGNASANSREQFADEDADNVGDACDNCNLSNGFKACKSAFDCGGARCLIANVPVFGTCDGIGTACLQNSDCPTSAIPILCTIPTLAADRFGRCEKQIDDEDGDGIGGACDACRTVTDSRITTNSNPEAEGRNHVTAFGDLCDQVPQAVSRGIEGRIDFKTGAVLSPLGSTREYTTFHTTLGLGIGADPPTNSEEFGFRYCSCVSAGRVLDRNECMTTVCSATDDAYDTDPRFQPASTAAALGTSRAPTDEPELLGNEYIGGFTSNVFPREPNFAHRTYVDDFRLGDMEQITLWNHTRDGVPFVGLQSAAVFLSHVKRGSVGGYNSLRDLNTLGLRDSFDYVPIPLVDFVQTRGSQQFTDCVIAGCQMWHRWDWVINPADYVVNPSPLDLAARYGRFSPDAEGAVAVVGRTSDPAIDVTSALSDYTTQSVRAAGVSFLMPVESSLRSRRLATPLAAVTVAQPWRRSAGAPTALVIRDGRVLATFEDIFHDFGLRQSASVAALAEPELAPADRDASRAVFSATEEAVYLVGGHFLSGQRTGEVWRYSLASRTWESIFQSLPVDTSIGDVRAIAYDEREQQIVVIDEGLNEPSVVASNSGRGSGPVGERTGRLVLIDIRNRTMTVLARMPRTDKYRRVGLVHRGGGEYAVVRAHKNKSTYSTFTFRISASTNAQVSLAWTGKGVGSGELLDDPIRTSLGVLLPVGRGSVQDIDVLSVTPASFGPEDL
jgi:hypothetical protein